jgi:hypothetical protein
LDSITKYVTQVISCIQQNPFWGTPLPALQSGVKATIDDLTKDVKRNKDVGKICKLLDELMEEYETKDQEKALALLKQLELEVIKAKRNPPSPSPTLGARIRKSFSPVASTAKAISKGLFPKGPATLAVKFDDKGKRDCC